MIKCLTLPLKRQRAWNMHKINRYLLQVFLCVLSINVNAQSIQEKLNIILQRNDIQELNRFLPQIRDSLDDFTRNVAEGYLHSGMNRPDMAFKCYDNLIKQYSDTYDMTSYLSLAVREQINLGLYKEAKQYIERFYYKDTLPQGIRIPFPDGHQLSEYYAIAYSLQNCAPSKIIRTSNKPISIKQSKVKNGFWMIPGIVNNGGQENFVFDTGASFDVISEDFARRNSIRSFTDTIKIPGITGETTAKIGFIDSITIEDMTYQNIWVLILPSIAPVTQRQFGYTIDAILGIPFLKTIGTVELYPQKNKMVFPVVGEQIKPKLQSNMSLLELLRVEVAVGPIKRMLPILDTGFDCFLIGKPLYDSHSNDFQLYDFKKKKLGIAGVTESVDTTYVWTPDKPVPIKMGAARIKYKDILIEEDRNNPLDKHEILGTGVINKFKKVTLDLNTMILETK